MDIRFFCPSCIRELSVPEEYAGQAGNCPLCGAAVTVPPRPEAVPAAAQGQPYGYAAPTQPVGWAMHGASFVAGSQTHPLAIASLVLGIASFVVCFFIPAVPGLICGVMARKRIGQEPQTYTGDRVALAGIIVSAINIALTVLLMALVLAGPLLLKAAAILPPDP
jgi:hypothetical protein